MPRTAMAAIIGELRTLVGDPAGASQVFSDDQLQSFLDRNREFRNYADLMPVESRLGGAVQYLEFFALDKYFESDAKIYDSTDTEITPVTSGFLNGQWTFSQSYLALTIRGFAYDLMGAAADVCEAWMQKVKFDFDFSADNQSYKESQKFKHLQDLAANFRSKAVFASKGANAVGTAAFGSSDWSCNA